MRQREHPFAVAGLYRLLYGFNGAVVLLFAGFMSVTQEKINTSMAARSFLETLPAVPLPASQSFGLAVFSFGLLLGLSWLYRRRDWQMAAGRYLILGLEIGACILLMRSINLAYDGVVLLVVADLMHGYEGRNQRIILMAAMVGLYLIANYNLAVFQMKVVPLEAYLTYYTANAQGIVKAVVNIFTSINLILFVLYMVMLVQSQHREKERIQSLNAQLNEANEKLRAYALQAEHMAETRERNRLAREIHDTIGHALTGIVAGIDACIATFEAMPEFTRQQLPKIRESALRGITDVRRSVKKLRPDDLERLPLKEALQTMIKDFSASTGMEIVFETDDWPSGLREDEEEVIYRVVQEGITNANQHGHASRVSVSIRGGAVWLRIRIADNGTGCTTVKPDFGLRHMQERLELLKGTLQYYSRDGFVIEAAIPMHRGGNVHD